MPPKDDKSGKGFDAERGGVANLEELRALYDLMVKENLEFVEVKDVESRLRLSRQSQTPVFASSPPIGARQRNSTSSGSAAPTPAEASQPAIHSPLAGIFYRSSSPTTAPFAKEGDIVETGQTLCIVEAMKVMNEIKAESRLKILRISAENATPVAAGQALFLVEPAP